jgi:hypothetical protein
MKNDLGLNKKLENLLEEILNSLGKIKIVVVGKELFDLIDEDVFIYTLGHFSISVKPMLPPFCNFLMDKTIKPDSYYVFNNEKECDIFLLQNYYKDKKRKNESSR